MKRENGKRKRGAKGNEKKKRKKKSKKKKKPKMSGERRAWSDIHDGIRLTLEQIVDATVEMSDRAKSARLEGWRGAMRAIMACDGAQLARALRHTSANAVAAANTATLLQVALRHGDAECVTELLDRGADPNVTRCGVPPLAFAVFYGAASAVRLLIKRGARWEPFTVAYHVSFDGGTRYVVKFEALGELVQYAKHHVPPCGDVLEAHRCAGCRQQLAARRCARCMLVRYCCVECQRADRAAHRAVCDAAPEPTRRPRRPRQGALAVTAAFEFDLSQLTLSSARP